jgi:hypothetical protein
MPRHWQHRNRRGKLAQAGPLFALFLFGWSVFSYDDKDTPLKSTGKGDAGSEIVQGIAGRITDSSGQPIAGASVQPKSLDEEGQPIPEIFVVTDAEGRYSWRLFPGKYEVSVSAAGYRGDTKEATVKPKQKTILDFTLKSAR